MWERLLHRILRWLAKPLVWVPLLICLLLLGGALGFRASRIAGIPDVGDPFDVEVFGTVVVADADNAYVHYRTAFSKLTPISRSAWDSRDLVLEQGWSAANDDLRKWLEDNANALEHFRRGSECPDSLRIQPKEIDINNAAAALGEHREMTRLALLNAARLTKAGQVDDAWLWQRCVLRNSRHQGMHGTYLDRLGGRAAHSICLTALQNWAKDPRVEAGLLRHALADVISIFEMTPPASETLKVEYLFMMRSLNSSTVELFQLNNPKLDVPAALRGLTLFLYCEPEVNRRTTRLLVADQLARVDIPRHLRPPPPPQSPAIERGLRKTLFDESLPDTFASMDSAMFLEQARQAGMVLLLALQCHYREHGAFPESLDRLVDDYLDALPIDPFGKGEPMRYRRDPADERSVIVWSIGPDEADDGGLKELSNELGDLIYKVEPPSAK